MQTIEENAWTASAISLITLFEKCFCCCYCTDCPCEIVYRKYKIVTRLLIKYNKEKHRENSECKLCFRCFTVPWVHIFLFFLSGFDWCKWEKNPWFGPCYCHILPAVINIRLAVQSWSQCDWEQDSNTVSRQSSHALTKTHMASFLRRWCFDPQSDHIWDEFDL